MSPPIDSPDRLITYLIANYDNADYVDDCLDSLVGQTVERWRAIVCDDASTDASVDRIRRHVGSRIRLIQNDSNVGYIRTLIRLIGEASTDVVGILDADDMLAPTATERVLATYHAHPSAGLVYTNYTTFADDGTEEPGTCRAIPPGRSALTDGYVSHLKTFRVSAYAQTAGLDPALEYAEDRDLVYKLEEVSEVAFVDAPLYRYRVVPGSQSRDAHKARIGFAHHLEAQFAAIERRGTKGVAKAHLRAAFLAEYVRKSRATPSLDAALAETERTFRALT
ncbi:MAG: glycosyltransferase family A protein [Deltaproteobacteria bacterium]